MREAIIGYDKNLLEDVKGIREEITDSIVAGGTNKKTKNKKTKNKKNKGAKKTKKNKGAKKTKGQKKPK